MEIIDVNQENYEKCLNFLKKVKSLESIDSEVLRQASVIIGDDNEIEGILSYEKFASFGLVRYFIYKKTLADEVLFSLFNHLKEKIIKDQIKRLVAIIIRSDVVEVFKKLGFDEVNPDYFFIEETNILNTNFHDAYILTINLQ